MNTTTIPINPNQVLSIRCIGDVHGESESFASLVNDARKQGIFVVQLGDLIDFGPDAPGCLRLMRSLIENQQGLFVRSNHDDRLFRHLSGRLLKPSRTLDNTLCQIAAAPDGSELNRPGNSGG
ncbi:MAG TPA: hypothetical protein DCS31_10875 [Candidatus Competibacteraceae bacterium]|nr:hypothetical protein [Candidatus Competibacteraceae bacterium]